MITGLNQSCLFADVNECESVALNTCEQVCTNTDGGFTCSCNSGYVVNMTDPTKCDRKSIFSDKSLRE